MSVAIEPVRPAVIIANVRTGGTFLSHALSNHPDVYCVRGEILHSRGAWRQRLPDVDLVQLLDCTLHQPHYRVSMCKLTYSQAFVASIWDYLTRTQPRVLWLQRQNALRQAVSVILTKLGNKGLVDHPTHAMRPVPGARLEVDAEVIVRHARGLLRREARIAKRMAAFKHVLWLTYEEITANPHRIYAADGLAPGAGTRIAAFLKIRDMPMPVDLMRVNPQPLSEIIVNWYEVRAAIARDDKLAGFLEGEDG